MPRVRRSRSRSKRRVRQTLINKSRSRKSRMRRRSRSKRSSRRMIGGVTIYRDDVGDALLEEDMKAMDIDTDDEEDIDPVEGLHAGVLLAALMEMHRLEDIINRQDNYMNKQPVRQGEVNDLYLAFERNRAAAVRDMEHAHNVYVNGLRRYQEANGRVRAANFDIRVRREAIRRADVVMVAGAAAQADVEAQMDAYQAQQPELVDG